MPVLPAHDTRSTAPPEPQSHESNTFDHLTHIPTYIIELCTALLYILGPFVLPLLLLVAYSLSCICIGAIYIDDCPAKPAIAHSMIAQGTCCLAFCIFYTCVFFKDNYMDRGCAFYFSLSNLPVFTLPFVVALIYVPVITSTVYVYTVKGNVSSESDDPTFCSHTLYNFTYWFDTVFHIVVCLILYNYTLNKYFTQLADIDTIYWGCLLLLFHSMMPVIIIGGLNLSLCPDHPHVPIIALVLGALVQLMITLYGALFISLTGDDGDNATTCLTIGGWLALLVCTRDGANVRTFERSFVGMYLRSLLSQTNPRDHVSLVLPCMVKLSL